MGRREPRSAQKIVHHFHSELTKRARKGKESEAKLKRESLECGALRGAKAKLFDGKVYFTFKVFLIPMIYGFGEV